MVFLSGVNLLRRVQEFGRRGGGPDKFWRVQQYLRFSWKFFGRRRNCYGIGMRYVHKALMYSTFSRQQKKKEMSHLWNIRIGAAAGEHGVSRQDFLEGLARSNILLDRKVLTDLAIYEPRTFESLTEVAKRKMEEEGRSTISIRPGQIRSDKWN